MDNHDQGKELMRRLQKGDKSAFEELVMKYEQTVLNFAYRYLGDYRKAEDIAQETFLRIFKAYKTWKPKAKFRTWLLIITTRLCLNEIRSRKREKKALSPVSETTERNFLSNLPDKKGSSPFERVIEGERKMFLNKAIASLPENQKRALLLHKFEGLSYLEVAEVMGLSLEAVRSLLVRARKNLHKRLSPQLGDSSISRGARL